MMVLDSLRSLIDNTLEAVFNRPAHDPVRARKPLLSGIERARTQFENGSKAPNRWWKVRNGVVAFTVKAGGNTFDINGVATNHMPEDRFLEFLDKMKAAIEAGAFDAEIANKGNGTAKVRIPKRSRGISREAAQQRGRKAAETRAANKERGGKPQA